MGIPLLAELLGGLAEGTVSPQLRAGSVVVGLALGGANWLLTRRVPGTRLPLLTSRITGVAHTVGFLFLPSRAGRIAIREFLRSSTAATTEPP